MLIKNFSNFGIASSISKLDENHKISRFAFSNYSKLGIFLDFNCYNKNDLESVFSDVRFVFILNPLFVKIFNFIKIWTSNQAHNLRIFDELHYWLVFDYNSDIDNMSKIFRDEAFGLSTNFVIAINFFDQPVNNNNNNINNFMTK